MLYLSGSEILLSLALKGIEIRLSLALKGIEIRLSLALKCMLNCFGFKWCRIRTTCIDSLFLFVSQI